MSLGNKHEANILYEKMFRTYINKNAKIFIDNDWKAYNSSMCRRENIKMRDKILQLLDEGKEVRVGYKTTTIRNFHEYLIFYK